MGELLNELKKTFTHTTNFKSHVLDPTYSVVQYLEPEIIKNDQNVQIPQTNYYQKSRYLIEDSDNENESIGYDLNDPLTKEIFLNATKIYSKEKIPLKIAQKIIQNQNKAIWG